MLLTLYTQLSDEESFTLTFDDVCAVSESIDITLSAHADFLVQSQMSDTSSYDAQSAIYDNDIIVLNDALSAYGRINILLSDNVGSSLMDQHTVSTQSVINELLHVMSTCDSVGEVLTAFNTIVGISDSSIVQLLFTLDFLDDISTNEAIDLSLSNELMVSDTVTLSEIIKAFQYFKIKKWSLSKKATSFKMIPRASKFKMLCKKAIMIKKERTKQWSLVNRDTLAWKLQVA